MKKDKKGFLLAEETLKIILAVIAIGFLAYLLFSIYNANRDAKNLELAEESLNHLMQEINAERTEVQIYNPENWIICSWSDAGEMPKSCSNLGWKSCICICKKNTPDKCDSNGICMNNPSGSSRPYYGTGIKIEEPLPITLSIDYQNKIISKINEH